MLREACREAASWPKPLQIAVNLSPVQFRHGDLAGLVHQVLLDTALAPGRLELEITESVLMDDLPRALSILRRLKALGVRIAMDDFGTGYSSLSNLQAFPFDKIKIDRSFISDLERNAQSATIVRAVIALGRGLNLPVVAEGVETRAQLEFLAREACSEVQGFLLGRPLPIANMPGSWGARRCPARRRAWGKAGPQVSQPDAMPGRVPRTEVPARMSRKKSKSGRTATSRPGLLYRARNRGTDN